MPQVLKIWGGICNLGAKSLGRREVRAKIWGLPPSLPLSDNPAYLSKEDELIIIFTTA